jgi:hypothetical protein
LHIHLPHMQIGTGSDVLCVSCHSEEAGHTSLKASPEYFDFLLLRAGSAAIRRVTGRAAKRQSGGMQGKR